MNMKESLTQHLLKQGLGDISETLAQIVMEQVLPWKDEEPGKSEDARAIIAFSFGFRFEPNGNRKPGPVNKQLADLVSEYYNKQARPVYAQWEIAEALAGRVSKNHLHTIYPKIGKKTGNVEYLSAVDVLDDAIDEGLNPDDSNLNPVLVIAHRYHLVRYARLVKDSGFTVVTAPDMPSACDPESGQSWTADEVVNIVTEIISRLSAYRKEYVEDMEDGLETAHTYRTSGIEGFISYDDYLQRKLHVEQ